ncbi:hypothetical protein LF65_05604 [Clostridium beijerinckii]|uniref:Phage-related minor tail protein n=1 Tax=Clostridium beijerinckii TaxID=1520 RepID=A0A0B5QV76_CLOBE|nr:hypothetical protein [Clostridium beijerinckii]AJH02112.1 hypothetical protein LF65_05604 [Clostridium beijerinckii]
MAGSSRIKGITIELDGNTTGLQKALSGVTQQSIDIQKELKDVERLLKFDPGNVEALAQKQSLLARQVENTTQKLNQLKEAESQVEQQFASGDLGETQYRAFRREIEFTERELNNLNQSLRDVGNGTSISSLRNDLSQVSDAAGEAQESVEGLGGELTGLAAGAAAGMGIGEIIEKSLDTSSLNTKIDISFNVPEESVQSVKNAISTVETYGVDSEAALEGVRREWALNKDASDESNSAVVQGAATIVAAYGDVDFTELIQETNELSKTLGISNEDAIALTYSLLQTGFPPDQLDIITEYGSQLSRAGYSAQEIQGIMAAGVETGTWNIDVLLDGLKEGRIVLAEFGQGVDKTTAGLIEGTGISVDQLQAWGKSVANGGEEGKKAMTDVAAAVAGIDDKTKQNAIGVKFFGTLWEENGTKITDTILGMNNNLMTAEENQNNLNAATEALNSDPAIQMQTAISNLMTALAPVLTVIANIVGEMAKWIANNPTLAATIASIVSIIGILIGVAAGLAPIITAISTAGISAASVTGALGVAITALTGPIGIAIAAIAGFIAAFVALYNTNEDFKNNVNQTWEQIKTTISEVIETIKTIISEFTVITQEIWAQYGTQITAVATDVWNNISIIIQTVMNAIKDWLNVAMALLKGDWQGAWEGIKQGFADVWGGIFNLLKNTIALILSEINLFTGGAITSIVTWCSNMLSSVTTGMNSVKTSISDIWNSIKSFFESINLFDIGKNIIQGLINGIKSMASSVSDTIKNIANSIPEGVKKLLDIHSPSRVMFGLGEYTGEGFGNGIGSTIGNISRQANSLAAAAIPNVNVGSYDMGLNASSGGIGSASNLDRILSTMDSMRNEMASLKEALNIRVDLDGKTVGKMITPTVSNQLAFNSGRKGF